MRKPISTFMHGIWDYTAGPALLVLPNLLKLSKAGRLAAELPRGFGAATLAMSPLTRYEWGVKKVLPMKTHLAIDSVSAGLLTVAPWIFGFARKSWKPSVVLGLGELAIVMLTDPKPSGMRKAEEVTDIGGAPQLKAA